MTGCMVSSSLSIAPALHVAMMSDFVDLDGPVWLREDRPGGIGMEGGFIHPPAAGFWGVAGMKRIALLARCILGAAAPPERVDLIIRGGTVSCRCDRVVGDVAISGVVRASASTPFLSRAS